MARIFLDQNETFTVGGSDDTLLGQAGGDPGEGVLVGEGATGLETNAEIERLDSPLALSAHTFQVTDNGLEISANGNTIVTIPSLNQTLELRTADGSIDLSQTGAEAFTATNPTDSSDTATIGTSAVTPSIGVDASEISETAPEQSTVSVSDNGPVDEGSTATFTVNLSESADSEVTVDYSIGRTGGASADDHGTPTIDGNDVNLSGTLTFAAGETSQTIDIPVKEDAISPEDGEGLSVSLSNLSGPDVFALGNASTTASINNVPLNFELTQVSEDVREGDQAQYKVEASAPVDEDTDVSFNVVPGDPNANNQSSDASNGDDTDGIGATNLNDFSQGAFNPSTTTISAGDTTTTFTVSTQNEGLTELPETFTVEARVDGRTLTTTTVLDDGGATGTLFTLTQGADGIQPGAADRADRPTPGPDTFRGTDDGDFTSADELDGGGGTDTVETPLSADGSDDTIRPTLTGIERVRLDTADTVDDANDTVTFDGSRADGLARVTIADLNRGVDTSDAPSTARVRGIDTDVRVVSANARDSGNALGSRLDVAYTNASGGGDSATVGLVDTDLDAGLFSPTLKVDGVEDLTLDVAGSGGSSIKSLTAPDTTRLTVAGSQKLTVGNGIGSSLSPLRRVEVTGELDTVFSGVQQPLTVIAGDGDDTLEALLLDNAFNVSGGAGDDRIDLGLGDDDVHGGPGNDVVDLDGQLTTADQVAGGAGFDIATTRAQGIDEYETDPAPLGALTGFEALGIKNDLVNGDGVVAMGELPGFNRFAVTSDSDVGGATVAGLGRGATVLTTDGIETTGPLDVDVRGATDAGSDGDSLTFRYAIREDWSGTKSFALDVAGINTLSIEVNDVDPATEGSFEVDLDAASALETVHLAGNGDVLFRSATIPTLADIQRVDATGLDGDLFFNLAGVSFNAGEGLTVIGGAGNDTMYGTPFGDDLTNGPGADDIIYSGLAFGSADRVRDFGRGDDEFFIGLTLVTAAAVSGDSLLASDDTPTAGGITSNATGFVVYTTDGGTRVISVGAALTRQTPDMAATLTDDALFRAASRGALQASVEGVVASNATMATNVGIAVGVTTSTGRLMLFRVSDTDTTTSGTGTTTVTNTIATLGSGTIAASDIAVF